MSLLRAFIAIEIPDQIKKAIAVKSADLRKSAEHSVRWVAPENLHLTLKFLGEVSPASVELLCQTLQAECSQHTPFEITAGGLGCFPTSRHPRIIWIGLKIPAELNRLQHKLETATARLGYAAEEKPFAPHLTLGRVREQATPPELQTLQASLQKSRVDDLGSFQAESVQLFKSDLRSAGPVYTSLFRAPLGYNQVLKTVITQKD